MSAAMSRLSLPGVLLAVGLVASCGGDDGAATPTTTTAPAAPVVRLDVTDAVLVSDDAPRAELADPVRAEVLGVVERFLQLGTVVPLTTGEVGEGIEELLTDEARQRFAEEDRSALVDEGTPPSDRVEVVREEATLSGLARGGDVELVVVRVALEAAGDDGARVHRHGELTVVPVDGSWRISGWEMVVERSDGTDAAADGEGS
jgi:hypothetical protein